MKIKRKELSEIANGIDLYDAQKLQHFRLTLLLTKNKKLINEESGIFEEAKKKILPTAEIEKIKEAQAEIAKKYWEKNEKGEWVMEDRVHELNGMPVHKISNKAKMNGEIETLFTKKKAIIDRYNDGLKKAEALLEEEIEIALLKITDAEWVKQLSPKTLSALAPIIGIKIPEQLLEEKGDALTTTDLERILDFCELE